METRSAICARSATAWL